MPRQFFLCSHIIEIFEFLYLPSTVKIKYVANIQSRKYCKTEPKALCKILIRHSFTMFQIPHIFIRNYVNILFCPKKIMYAING